MQKQQAVTKTLLIGDTIQRLCARQDTTVQAMSAKHWPNLYETMKRARTDIVGTAAAVFGTNKSVHHLAEYAYPLKGPELSGHAIDVRQSLRPDVSLQELILALGGELRKLTAVWKLFVEGCFCGKIRGINMADPATINFCDHIGSETETLIRLELIKRFGEQGFCWQKSNDGTTNQRYMDFRALKSKVVLLFGGCNPHTLTLYVASGVLH
jgi:hypothetical protein